MKNFLPTLKKSISMNREIYEFEQNYEAEKQEQIELVRKSIEKMNTALASAFAGNLEGFQAGQLATHLHAAPAFITPRQFGIRGSRGISGMMFYDAFYEASENYHKQRAIQAIRVKYQGNRSERRSKNKNNNTFNERPTTLQDVIKQKQNRIRYSFNSTNISNKFSNNKYDKGINNRW